MDVCSVCPAVTMTMNHIEALNTEAGIDRDWNPIIIAHINGGVCTQKNCSEGSKSSGAAEVGHHVALYFIL